MSNRKSPVQLLLPAPAGVKGAAARIATTTRTRRRRRKKGSGVLSGAALRSAPATQAIFGIGSNRFEFGPVDRLAADCDTRNGTTVRGRTLWKIFAGSGLTTNGILSDGVLVGYTGWDLTPYSLGDTLYGIADVYTWYRFRRVCLTYLPQVGTGTHGAFALAIKDQAYDAALAPDTVFHTMNHANASLGPVWGPITVEYEYNSAKVWLCHTSSIQTIGDRAQLCVFGTGSGHASATNFGLFVIDFVIDFFETSTNAGTPSLGRPIGSVPKEPPAEPTERSGKDEASSAAAAQTPTKRWVLV